MLIPFFKEYKLSKEVMENSNNIFMIFPREFFFFLLISLSLSKYMPIKYKFQFLMTILCIITLIYICIYKWGYDGTFMMCTTDCSPLLFSPISIWLSNWSHCHHHHYNIIWPFSSYFNNFKISNYRKIPYLNIQLNFLNQL